MARTRTIGAPWRHSRTWFAAAASVGLSVAANAKPPDHWLPERPVGVLDRVVLKIHWFDSKAELREAAKSSGQLIDPNDLKGFSFLKRNTETGEYVCELYVVKMRGASVDDDRTMTFGHEVLHCFGLRHR